MTKTDLSKEREKEIIAAAREVFKRYGYKKTTMVDIAETIGLNQATLYHYFKNKEDIFIEKILAEHEEFREKRLGLLDEETAIKRRISLFFHLKLEFFYSNRIYEQLAELKLDKVSEDHRRKLASLGMREQAYVKGLLDKAVQGGELPSSLDISQLTRIMFQILQGVRLENHFNYYLSRQGPRTELMMKEMEQSIQYLFNILGL